ncbi:aminotransferase class I/II-fold pyridoxal phosphate-dependent enzyme [Roseibium sp. AS2]|uniref:DegT/DnrJ/EryC1/StrS family aminotransferase n=1 Tax=Roseibium sp. AS2 TaxID=3135781 RepID=UPI00317042C9
MIEQVRATFLPFSQPVLGDEEIEELVACVRSGWITTGPRTAQFEALFRERLGVAHAIAVTSASAGWHIAAHALGIGPGDEVIVPAITWASSANMVELLGARAVFADVLPETLQVNPEDVARRITSRTRAVIPVHFAGAPCDLTALRQLVEGTGVTLVEDAAHALGTWYQDREIGSDGHMAIFSFHPIKNITTGEGGMVVLNDDTLAERLRLLRFHGVTKDAWSRYNRKGAPEYEIIEPGYKYNMPDMQAALGLRQLPKLDGFNSRRAQLAARYTALLEALPEIAPLAPVPYAHHHAWHLYIVRIEQGALRIGRNEVLDELARANIGAGLHFPPLHTQPYYRNKYHLRPEDCPCAADAGSRILSLPLYPSMTDADQDDVITALERVVQRYRA